MRIILPSRPVVPAVAQAATTLLTQIILPIEPPIVLAATIIAVLRPKLLAACSCRLANSVTATVLEPEINAPSTPIIGEIIM